jgi:hypothetical protein
MTERAPYSRVYWSIVDDERFATVYDSDAHLAAWLRLLLIADQAWPASAHLPASVRSHSVKALIDAGLLVVNGSKRYRIHGLDSERTRRAEQAKQAAFAKQTGTGRSPNGQHPQTGRAPEGPYARVAETRQDETSRVDDIKREFDERVLATYRRLHRQGSHTLEKVPHCPLCEIGADETGKVPA